MEEEDIKKRVDELQAKMMKLDDEIDEMKKKRKEIKREFVYYLHMIYSGKFES